MGRKIQYEKHWIHLIQSKRWEINMWILLVPFILLSLFQKSMWNRVIDESERALSALSIFVFPDALRGW